MRVDTDRAIQAVRVENDLRSAITAFRGRLRREALSFAVDALYDWVARGVETFRANRGWIFLLDNNNALQSIPGAAVRCSNRHKSVPYQFRDRSFVWRVFLEKNGDFTNDVSKISQYMPWDDGTKSELAVPLFDEDGVEGGKVIGVYNLEADHENAFFPAYVHELQRNVTLLTVHLLVLRDWYQRSPDSDPWVWHPEPHGWNPGKLLQRFCRAVVRGAKPGGKRQPVCAIWNADPNYAWCLANSGLDYEFQAEQVLPSQSATAQVAAAPARCIRRGNAQELRCINRDKLDGLGVTEGYIASLRRLDASVRGTLNLYALDKATVLPPEKSGVEWLAQQAEDLLATLNRQREAFAKAYVHSQLTKSATAVPSAHIFRRAVMKVLPADAMTIFIPDAVTGPADAARPVRLMAIDTTGLMHAKDGKPAQTDDVSFQVCGGGQQEESLTAWCYVHADRLLRLNVPSDRTSGRYADLPSPSTNFPEILVYGDADPENRRRLGVAVKDPVGDLGAVGVIRMYRSSKGRPFTEADARLLYAIASSEKCRRLFNDWTLPNSGGGVSPPLRTALVNELQKALKQFGEVVRAGHVYLLFGQAYQEYACHPQHEDPPKSIRIESHNNATRGITRGLDGTQRVQCWFKLFSWLEAHLWRAIVAFDFPDKSTARDHEPQVYKACLAIAALLSDTNWDPHRSLFGLDSPVAPLLAAYAEHAGEADRRDIERRHGRNRKDGKDAGDAANLPPLSLTPAIIRAHLRSDAECRDLPWHLDHCPDADLAEYGVTISSNGAQCLVPLRLADRPYTNLVCDLSTDFGAALGRAIANARRLKPPGARIVSPAVDDEWIWRRLRHNVGLVVGGWSRWVARFIDYKLSSANTGRI